SIFQNNRGFELSIPTGFSRYSHRKSIALNSIFSVLHENKFSNRMIGKSYLYIFLQLIYFKLNFKFLFEISGRMYFFNSSGYPSSHGVLPTHSDFFPAILIVPFVEISTVVKSGSLNGAVYFIHLKFLSTSSLYRTQV